MRNVDLVVLGALLFSSTFSFGCGGADGATPNTPAGGAGTAGTPAVAGDPSLPKALTKPDSPKCTWKKQAGKSCHVNAKTDGDLAAAVAGIANVCVDTKAMHAVGAAETGDSSTAVKQIPLKVSAGHCYRIIGLAQTTVTDFDIALMASDGKSCGEDLNDSNDAILLEDGVICFAQDDTVSVNAAVAAGQGKWALQVWSD